MDNIQRKKASMVLSRVWRGEMTPQKFFEEMARQAGVKVSPDFLDVWEAVHGHQMSVNEALVEIEDLICVSSEVAK